MAEKGQAARFHSGELTDGWRWFGAHPRTVDGKAGWEFRVWAPNARAVAVAGDFNQWSGESHPLTRNGQVWEGFIPGLSQFETY